jgi:hypothetical protein
VRVKKRVGPGGRDALYTDCGGLCAIHLHLESGQAGQANAAVERRGRQVSEDLMYAGQAVDALLQRIWGMHRRTCMLNIDYGVISVTCKS